MDLSLPPDQLLAFNFKHRAERAVRKLQTPKRHVGDKQARGVRAWGYPKPLSSFSLEFQYWTYFS